MSIDTILDRLPPGGIERDQIRHAYTFAARWHEGQQRYSGAPYITHPLAVAETAAAMGLDATMICAAFLHDVLAYTACSDAELSAEFGAEITALVRGLTDLKASGDAGLQAATDRVLTLKLLDLLNNMQTLQYLDEQKQITKSRETLSVMAPLAFRLGLDNIAGELETLARARLNGPAPAGMSSQPLSWAAVLLPRDVRSRYLDEWLGELDVLPTRKDRLRFAGRVLMSAPYLALILRNATWVAALCWILRSDLRTWPPLIALLAWITAETAQNSLGDAAVVLITVPPVLNTGVKWLRAKFT